MRRFSFTTIGLSALAFACAPARTTPPAPAPEPVVTPPRAPAPATTPPPANTPAPAPATTVTPREAAPNWQLLDPTTDRVPGIGAERAIKELLAGKQPRRTVVVAVIDGGVDTAHADLVANLWKNPKETPGNGKDDDGNGYVDDVHGWNFIGGADGKDVHHDTFELTRIYVRCTKKADSLPAPDPAQCAKVSEEYDKKKEEVQGTLGQIQMAGAALSRSVTILKQELKTDSVSVERVEKVQSLQPEVVQAKRIYLQLAANGITPEIVDEAKTEYQSQVDYGLNASYDPRPIVGDNYADATQRKYGNTDVTGPDAKHGTHVSGIIGASRGNGTGVDGIATSVRIMAVRAVPDGDERDKDIANAIRYAADNGANIINMSFGKAYSPQKSAVDEAVKYADAKGVLMVHAAGNDGEDLDTSPQFPTRKYLAGGMAQNWIEVGASSWKGADSLAASFSNYSHAQVDVFAPGENILSTIPGGRTERESGTSMAAPVVSGLAALIMAYYPELTAAQVKTLILDSSTRYTNQPVVVPGSKPGAAKMPFGQLSITGGVVNAFAAIKAADAMVKVRQ